MYLYNIYIINIIKVYVNLLKLGVHVATYGFPNL